MGCGRKRQEELDHMKRLSLFEGPNTKFQEHSGGLVTCSKI